jgi:hypothetical protein
MATHRSLALVVTASAVLAPAISTPNAPPSPESTPSGVWVPSGWTPAHRMCEMDGPAVPDVARWRCVRPLDGPAGSSRSGSTNDQSGTDAAERGRTATCSSPGT